MGQSFKKVLIISAVIIIVAGVIAVIYPHVDALNGDTLEKRIILHQTSNDPGPFYIENKTAKLKVIIAENETERAEGLSGTPSLGENEGMLFVFDEPGYYQMWMKGMLLSLDIIWLDKNFYIIDIKKNISPNTYPESFGPQSKAQYVLEVNAGYSDAHQLMIGDKWKASEVGNDF